MQCIVKSALGAQASLFAHEPTSSNVDIPITSPPDSVLSSTSTSVFTTDIAIQVGSTMEWDFVCSPDTPLVDVAQVVEASIRCNLEQIVGGINHVFVYELCAQTDAIHMTSIRFNTIMSPSCTGCEEATANEIREALERIAIDGSLAGDIERLSKGAIRAEFGRRATSTYHSATNSPLTPNTTPNPSSIAIQSPTPPTSAPTRGNEPVTNPTAISTLAPSPAPDTTSAPPFKGSSAPISTTLPPTETVSNATTPNTSVSNETDDADAAFYPDWHGENTGCLNDGNQPDWVTANALYYISDTLEECCIKFYQWNYVECTGLKPGTGKWYMQYSTGKCVKDCEDQTDCGGYAADWDNLWDSKMTCCLKQKWWDVTNC